MLKKAAIALVILLAIAFIAGLIVYIVDARLPLNQKTTAAPAWHIPSQSDLPAAVAD
jgi:uncharacterized alpha/beta hydrolase family protein